MFSLDRAISLDSSMSTKPTAQVKLSALSVDVRFGRPVARLLETSTQLVTRLLDGLHEFGARLEGFRVDPYAQDLSQATYSCPLFDGHGSLKVGGLGYSLNIGSLQTDTPEQSVPDVVSLSGAEGLTQLLSAVDGLLKEIDPNATPRSYGVQYTAHVELTGTTSGDLIHSFIGAEPKGLGTVRETTVRFSFQPQDGDQGSWLLLEPSTLIRPHGLFVSVRTDFLQQEVALVDAPTQLVQRARQFLARDDCPVRLS